MQRRPFKRRERNSIGHTGSGSPRSQTNHTGKSLKVSNRARLRVPQEVIGGSRRRWADAGSLFIPMTTVDSGHLEPGTLVSVRGASSERGPAFVEYRSPYRTYARIRLESIGENGEG
ncbi:uncharacterized protein LOC143154207 [Ptiloglossa arizonensis]|uniref:uncharacterized protein LOC143154207 n=1 Tax=Ptiloglossa arizonensis TaxID=3350558 RepID=UPI003FA16BB1